MQVASRTQNHLYCQPFSYLWLVVTDFDPGLPSIRRIQKTIQEKQSVEIKLSSGEILVGHVRWQDPECIGLVDGAGHEILVWRQGILYLKPKVG